MRKRIAGIDVAKISGEAARAYAEQKFEKAGQNLDDVLPNFDVNFALLKKKLTSAKSIPRIQMPVIEPSDMPLFKKRISEGSVDIFKPYAKGKLYMPKKISRSEGEEWIDLGFQDGSISDDKVPARVSKVAVGKMKPTQSQIWLDKLINNIIKWGAPASGSPVLSQTIIGSKEGYILDGHHRFGQAILANPGLGMKTLVVPFGIDLLVKVGKTYGEAIGNKPKASIEAGYRKMNNREKAIELVRKAEALVSGKRKGEVPKDFKKTANLKWSTYYDALPYSWIKSVDRLIKKPGFQKKFANIILHPEYWSDIDDLGREYGVRDWRVFSLVSIYLYGYAIVKRGDIIGKTNQEPKWLTKVLDNMEREREKTGCVASKNLIGKRKVRESARNYTLLKDVRTKKGVEFSKGESLKLVKYGSKYPYGVKFQDESGNQIVLIAETAHKKLKGFPKPPSFNTMEKWMSDAVAKSIDGKRVEPDGFSPSGAPSWLLALGLI